MSTSESEDKQKEFATNLYLKIESLLISRVPSGWIAEKLTELNIERGIADRMVYDIKCDIIRDMRDKASNKARDCNNMDYTWHNHYGNFVFYS